MPHITDRADIDVVDHRNDGQRDNTDQRRWQYAADDRHQWKQVNDTQPGSGHRINVPGDISQFWQLRHKDQDSQRVHKPGHYGTGHKAHQATEFQIASADLQQPGQQRSCKQILQAVLLYKSHHQQRHSACRGGDHTGAAADEGNHHRNTERGIQTHFRVHTGDNGKSDGFGNQRQRHHNAGKQIAAYIGKPVGLKLVHHIVGIQSERANSGRKNRL